MPLSETYLDRSMKVPCTVHTRYPGTERDEHGNVIYVEDTYDCLVFCQQQQRAEDGSGRAATGGYIVFFNAADVFAHTKPSGYVTLDAFSWLDVTGIGRLEVEAEPSFPVSLLTPTQVHHVEVTASNATTVEQP